MDNRKKLIVFTIFLYIAGAGLIILGIFSPMWESLLWEYDIWDKILEIIIGSVAILIAIILTLSFKMGLID